MCFYPTSLHIIFFEFCLKWVFSCNWYHRPNKLDCKWKWLQIKSRSFSNALTLCATVFAASIDHSALTCVQLWARSSPPKFIEYLSNPIADRLENGLMPSSKSLPLTNRLIILIYLLRETVDFDEIQVSTWWLSDCSHDLGTSLK